MPDGFRAFLEDRRGRVDQALRRALDALGELLPPALAAAAEDGVMSGGKRLRPLLVVVACEETGGEATPAVYDLAASVELLHAYSLMHDDLPCMDDAPLRRGRPAPHAVHGNGVAAVAGAVLVPWAAAWAHDAAVRAGRTPAQARAVAVRLLEAVGAGGMIGGQALDLLAEGRRVAEAELEALHALKTGALLAASLEAGVMAAGGDGRALEAAGTFGRRVGLAFQLMDDVLDATATAAQMGKRPSDAERDKSTYVAVLGVEGARARARQLVEQGAAALDAAGLAAPRLRRLGRFVLDRRR